MKYSIIYSDSDGNSHFKDADMVQTETDFAPPAAPLLVSQFWPSTRTAFVSCPQGWVGESHPTPARQLAVAVVGGFEVVAGSGETRRFHPGDVLLLEDTHGKGHVTRNINPGTSTTVFIQLADDAPPHPA